MHPKSFVSNFWGAVHKMLLKIYFLVIYNLLFGSI